MAWLVEPGFGVSAAVDAVELERRVADHRIDLVADDKRRGILLLDLDAVTRVFGKAAELGNVSDTDGSRWSVLGNRVAFLVVGRGVCPGDDRV